MTAGRRLWIAVAAIAAIGLALRIAAAQGALWLDEAWSAVQAHDVGTPLGVFLKINHDNNHHLNTLWLQMVGLDTAPVVQRGLSILTGTATVVVAALIGRRDGKAMALVAALIFAISPLLVTYGSEARGYAPMVLALMVAVLLTARWLDDPAQRLPAIPLALASLLGMASQLTMAFGLAAMAVWIVLTLYRAYPLREAAGLSIRILLPLALPALAMLALILWAAGGHLQFGNVEAFAWRSWWNGIAQMASYWIDGILPLLFLLLLLNNWAEGALVPKAERKELGFWLIALILLPLGIALAHLPNSGAPRYHLVSGIGGLMLIALLIARRLEWPGLARMMACGALVIVTWFALDKDYRLILDQRADPGRAIEAMRARAPAGADIAPEQERADAVLQAAALSSGYPLRIAGTPCPAPRFLFVDRDGSEAFPAEAIRCGSPYAPIAEAHPEGLSGTHWKLYERVDQDQR
ncbi:hypothetical protein [Sphingomonas sp. G-3-2-10]|uniref:hypothetical protein n=1 Tax=Sphingomonas sp. G-3-2-10 TaxID=2728838 RepID=UPI00146F7EDE|nr:hypothetical protein [Sphingomonas sp. G-3-2-10]NML05085.1 hypothetical protein [Sphingomonas sp. G-3-2-10]